MINFNIIQNVLGFIFNKKRFSVYLNDVEVLTGMSVLSYNVNKDSQFIEHPIETGSTIADHHIYNPVEISCKVAMPPKASVIDTYDLSDFIFGKSESFEDTYKLLDSMYKNSVKLRIKTDADVYENMYITGLPSDVDSSTADRQIFYISFKEAITIQPQYIKMAVGSVKNASNASYTKTGEVLPSKMSDETASKSKSWLKGLFG